MALSRARRQGRRDVNVEGGVVAGGGLDEIDQRHLVDDGLRVGHHDDGGDAAGGCRVARRLQGLAMLLAGLAGEHLHVDQAGAQHVALAVDDIGALRGVAAQMPTEVGDHAALYQQAARLVLAGRGVDQAHVEEGRRLLVGGRTGLTHAGPTQWLGSWRAIASSTAMRTATPISTWSRITLREWSAMVEAISTPRFIGPGCMISASGLARASFS